MSVGVPSRIRQLREASRAMLDGFSSAQLRRQSHPELSPLLWHVGHVFTVETYWLQERVFGRHAIDSDWRALHFPENCAKHKRSARLPEPASLRAWSHAIAGRNDRYWRFTAGHDHPLIAHGYLAAFIRQHYAQHLETMRLAAAQLRLAESRQTTTNLSRTAAQQPPSGNDAWAVAAHHAELGTAAIEAYDNEQPKHSVPVAGFRIDHRPVTNAQWLGFMQAGGYRDPCFWDTEGWCWRRRHSVCQPQHWWATPDGWHVPPEGDQPVARQPVHGISWYEARAFARYAGARLPHEAEWEAARRADALTGTGQVWEWCDNAFHPYPGFKAYPYEGYSRPWFDGAHYTTRGASRHTEADIRRPGFRNFYPPTHRHIHAGLRLAW